MTAVRRKMARANVQFNDTSVCNGVCEEPAWRFRPMSRFFTLFTWVVELELDYASTSPTDRTTKP